MSAHESKSSAAVPNFGRGFSPLTYSKSLPPPRFEPGSLDQELDALPTELTWLVERIASLRHWDSFYQIPSYIFLQIVARFYGVENEGRL